MEYFRKIIFKPLVLTQEDNKRDVTRVRRNGFKGRNKVGRRVMYKGIILQVKIWQLVLSREASAKV